MVGTPGAAAGTIGLRLGGRPGAELGHVGAAHHDEARGLELLDQVGGRRRAMVRIAKEARPPVERVAGAVAAGEILQQEGHAAEGPLGQRAGGLSPRALVVLVDDGVELRIEVFDQSDRSLDELFGRDLAPMDQRRETKRVMGCILRGLHGRASSVSSVERRA